MRQQILEIATKQMKRGGYENLNFANIASELGTSRANLHHHFKNKEGLGIAATEKYIQEEKAAFDEILCANDGDLPAILKALEDLLVHIALERGAEGCACICSQIIHESGAPESLKRLAHERVRVEEKDLEQQIKKAKKSGVLPASADARALAFRIMATMLGVGQMALVEQTKSKLTKSIKGSLMAFMQ